MWSMPNATKCFGLDAVKRARKREPFVMGAGDLVGLVPLLGIGLAGAAIVFCVEKFYHRHYKNGKSHGHDALRRVTPGGE